ncbi:MAG: type II toxin-antitoxin system RelE/ParE family toxin [Alphaproteobacteria bacterium]|nr:type II toxin-antitoxin system RelE/ParE family toxin [Alphaproteobacteria bacterium]
MIRTFRSKALRTYFETGSAKGLSVPNAERVGRMLAVLDNTIRPEDADLPGYRFHGLQGERRWSIRVSGNWRLTFGWDGSDVVDIDLEDYY